MDGGEDWKAWGVATIAVVIAVASLMISAGSCGQQDRNEQKIETGSYASDPNWGSLRVS